MEMKHFSHDHSLKLLEKIIDPDYMRFRCCYRRYSSVDQVYGCDECNYFIHQACSELPREIQHFYHPDHLLKLRAQPAEEEEVDCVACDRRCHRFIYRCVECPDFNMDVECALLPNKLEGTKSIHYRHHAHPLTLYDATNDEEDYCCFVCGTPCLDTMYRCDECDVSYHESCTKIDLPQEIHHYFHPHPLRLITNDPSKRLSDCSACQCYLSTSLFFECLDCAFYMHINCALLPDKLKQDGRTDHIHHFSHGHPLSLCDPGEQICNALKNSWGWPTYGCERCSFFIHESYIGLPRQINHPFHPPHSLTLGLCNYNDCLSKVPCSGCDKSEDNILAYNCGECNFLLDANCGGRNPTITFEGHKHVLTLKYGWNDYGYCCSECGAEIPGHSSYFECQQHCEDYKLHLLCGPLPCIIEDKCHIDSLKLMDAFVEDYNETDEVYCDTCEQLRDPNEPVYYCKECNFITEIKCVMLEVLRSLEGHHGNLKLRTANKTKISHNGWVFIAQCPNTVEEYNIEIEAETKINYIQEKFSEVKLDMSYKGLDFFTIEESVQILKIFQDAGVLYSLSETISERSISKTMGNSDFSWSELISSVKRQGLRSSSSYTTGKAQSESVIPSYSNEALTSLLDKLDSFYADIDFLSTLDIGAKIVGIGDLMIMQELASYLKGLLDAPGDFTTNSSLEPRLKLFFLNLLCSGVRSMCITNVREVDEIMLQRWWKLLKIVKHAGFEIQFAIERLSKIALAFFGRRVISSFEGTKSQIDETYDEVKEMEAKLDAKKRDLEALKSNLVLQKKAMEYERTPEMKKCLEYESKFKWKKVWEGSPIMFQKNSK